MSTQQTAWGITYRLRYIFFLLGIIVSEKGWVKQYKPVSSLWVSFLSDINQTVRIVLYSLIFLLSVLGNSLIIAVLVRNRRMRTVTNLFLLSLAISDLMVSLVCIPFTLIPNLMRDFIFGIGICKLVMYFMGEWLWDCNTILVSFKVFSPWLQLWWQLLWSYWLLDIR